MTHNAYAGSRSAVARGFQWSAFGVLAVIVLGLLLTGCASSPTQPGPEAEAAVYAAVVRQIYTVDDTFGGTLAPKTLYLVRNTDDTAGPVATDPLDSITLSLQVQDDITAALGDLPTKVVWVDARDAVPLDEGTHRVAGEGAIITLGNLHPQDNGTVQVPGSIWVAMLAAGGQTYVLEQVNGAWTITGTTGERWIS